MRSRRASHDSARPLNCGVMRPRYVHAIFFGALAGWSLQANQALAQCLEYEPAVATLHGLLIRETFPGAPNFESVASGDVSEATWILTLDGGVCVAAKDDLNVEANH